jgi:hypothetical protein
MFTESIKNKKQENASIKKHSIRLVLVFISLFILFASENTLYAAKCEPGSSCDECASKGERMKCKFDAFVNEGDKMLDKLDQSSAITDVQKEGIKKAKDRYSREKKRVKPEDFHLMAKKKDVNCQLVEILDDGIGNDDGICDPTHDETCVEILDDGIGNDDGICDPTGHPMKGKNREICAQICDEEAILEDENNINEGLAAEIEITYDGMTHHLKEVNETYPAAMSASPRSMVMSLNSDPCALKPQLERTSFDDYKKARWAVMGSRSGADVMERFCDQTYTSLFATWTLGAACIAAETAVVGINYWWEVVDIKESDLDMKAIDATMACASQAMNKSLETTVQIQVVENKVNDLKVNQAIILNLLSTPPGKRPDYPQN